MQIVVAVVAVGEQELEDYLGGGAAERGERRVAVWPTVTVEFAFLDDDGFPLSMPLPPGTPDEVAEVFEAQPWVVSIVYPLRERSTIENRADLLCQVNEHLALFDVPSLETLPVVAEIAAQVDRLP